MKNLIVLLLGFLTGAAIFFIGLVYNPFIGEQGTSPLSVTDAQTISLAYSGAASDSIVYTNDGESHVQPYPEKVLQLWEAPIRNTSAMATVMRDGRNDAIGLGIKISSLSESTRLIAGEALVDSVWYIYLPNRGVLFIEQTENYWNYFRNIILPAYRNGANTWKGAWWGGLTSGPGVLRTARVTGASGEFANMAMLGFESQTVNVWRVDGGPIAVDGHLLIELPETQVPVAVENREEADVDLE